MAIILTGSNGFLGNYLKGSLKGQDLMLFDRNRKDLIDWNFTKGIIHCAGLAHHSHDKRLKERYYEANAALTKELVNSFINSSAQFFIFLSTATIYENATIEDEIDELIIGNNLSVYAESKLIAESELLKVKSKKIFILRPSVIVGPNPKGNIHLLQRLIRSGLPIPVPFSTATNQLTDIRNLSLVIDYLISNFDKIESGIYNVNDNKKPDLQNLLIKIAEQEGVKANIFRAPNSFFKIALFLLRIIKPELSGKISTLLFRTSNISNKKISKLIPLPYNSFE